MWCFPRGTMSDSVSPPRHGLAQSGCSGRTATPSAAGCPLSPGKLVGERPDPQPLLPPLLHPVLHIIVYRASFPAIPQVTLQTALRSGWSSNLHLPILQINKQGLTEARGLDLEQESLFESLRNPLWRLDYRDSLYSFRIS